MVLTDNELGMIEQLCYLNGDVAKAAKVSGFSGIKNGHKNMTLGDILACFDEEALTKLENCEAEIDGACASGKEWAGIIRYLKSSRMNQMVLSDTMVNSDGTTLALCFSEKGNSSDAIVAFKGTSGGKEWIDNVEGLNVSDTQNQKEALDFIERLPYDSITVTGHSKGGNKAMYVAITSDKVTRCVAYDGQGFSQEFIDKYWAEIQAKGKIITNYSLSTDYVHALMFPVPNSNQVYCEGYGVENIKQHHSPNSFFLTDEDGNIVLDANGNPIVVQISEDESIQMLHEFTTFVINNADGNDKVVIIDFVSQLLAMVFGGGEVDTQEIIDYALDNPDTLAMIVAYLVKYMEVNNLSAEDIDKLLAVLGLDSLDEIFTFQIAGIDIVGLSGLIDFAKGQLTDENDDWWIKNVWLPLLKKWKFDGYNIDITTFWEMINSKVKEIDASGGCSNAEAKRGTIRDFSFSVYESLMNAISCIENMGANSFFSWKNYAHEEWYSSLHVGIAIKGISAYFSKLAETNQVCKARINTVFDDVKAVDDTISTHVVEHCQNLQTINSGVTSLAESIVV